MSDTWSRDDVDEAEMYVLGELLEEGPAAAEQDRHLMEDHLVDKPRLQRLGRDAPAHESDVLVADGRLCSPPAGESTAPGEAASATR